MSDKARILELVAEVIDSDLTPEVVCAHDSELLEDVKACLVECRNVRSQIDDLFPESVPHDVFGVPGDCGGRLPTIPDYEILDVLGRGGIGIIYQARRLKLDRIVALKMLLLGELASSSELARFMREAKAVAALQHPNIVQIYDVGEVDGRPFFTMEMVGGGSLFQNLGGVPQPAQYCGNVVETLARAIHFAHLAGIRRVDIGIKGLFQELEQVAVVAHRNLLAMQFSGQRLTRTPAPSACFLKSAHPAGCRRASQSTERCSDSTDVARFSRTRR